MDKKHQDDRKRDAPHKRTEEEKEKDEREYIEQRLRELRAWERRISGK